MSDKKQDAMERVMLASCKERDAAIEKVKIYEKMIKDVDVALCLHITNVTFDHASSIFKDVQKTVLATKAKLSALKKG